MNMVRIVPHRDCPSVLNCVLLSGNNDLPRSHLLLTDYLCFFHFSFPTILLALTEAMGFFNEVKKQGLEPRWHPLKMAIQLGRTEIVLYLLGLVSTAEDRAGHLPMGPTYFIT